MPGTFNFREEPYQHDQTSQIILEVPELTESDRSLFLPIIIGQ
jgi:hypothetical protein